MTTDKDGLSDLSSLKEALPESSDSLDIAYTEEELNAMRQVHQKLTEANIAHISPKFLAFTTISSKNRVDEAVKKYQKFLKSIGALGVGYIEDDTILMNDPNVLQLLTRAYCPAGRDREGRQILWIHATERTRLDEQEAYVNAGILYTLAVHADAVSLRNGISLIIDISKQSVTQPKIGNEQKLQNFNQAFPLRPQTILLAGASTAFRVVVNAVISVAAVFTKQKILDRIQFVSIPQAIERFDMASVPTYLGGGGGGITEVAAWTQQRLQQFPLPDLQLEEPKVTE